MNGELAQLVFLTSHGNAALTGVLPSDAAARTGPAFSHVRSVRFVDDAGHFTADDPLEWFDMLRANQAKRLWLKHLGTYTGAPAHTAEAFSGGVARSITVNYRDRAEAWSPRWAFDDAAKHWDVTYHLSRRGTARLEESQTLDEAGSTLRAALEAAIRFAQAAGTGGWPDFFTRALDSLQTRSKPKNNPLLPPAGFPPAAHHLLTAADAAWAFGGMGSWNDLVFDDDRTQQDYEQVTKPLYDGVMGAILTAANAFEPSLAR